MLSFSDVKRHYGLEVRGSFTQRVVPSGIAVDYYSSPVQDWRVWTEMERLDEIVGMDSLCLQ